MSLTTRIVGMGIVLCLGEVVQRIVLHPGRRERIRRDYTDCRGWVSSCDVAGDSDPCRDWT